MEPQAVQAAGAEPRWEGPQRDRGGGGARADDLVLTKIGPSGFHETPLDTVLRARDVDTLLVCGEATSGCVRATVVDACTRGYRVGVVGDCCFDRFEASHWVSLFDMDQKYADVFSADHAIDTCHLPRRRRHERRHPADLRRGCARPGTAASSRPSKARPGTWRSARCPRSTTAGPIRRRMMFDERHRLSARSPGAQRHGQQPPPARVGPRPRLGAYGLRPGGGAGRQARRVGAARPSSRRSPWTTGRCSPTSPAKPDLLLTSRCRSGTRTTAAATSAPAARWSPATTTPGRINLGAYRMQVQDDGRRPA